MFAGTSAAADLSTPLAAVATEALANAAAAIAATRAMRAAAERNTVICTRKPSQTVKVTEARLAYSSAVGRAPPRGPARAHHAASLARHHHAHRVQLPVARAADAAAELERALDV